MATSARLSEHFQKIPNSTDTVNHQWLRKTDMTDLAITTGRKIPSNKNFLNVNV